MDLIGATIWQLHAARQLRALGADPRLVGVDIDIGTGMPGERSGMVSDGRATARVASDGGTPGEGTKAPLTAPPPTTRPEKPAPSTSLPQEPRL